MVDDAPERGDAVWITLDPRVGREQGGRHPAITLSPLSYNRKVGLGVFCPITTQVKGYPFEVPIPANLEIAGVVLVDQIKSLDWRHRNAEFIIHLPNFLVLQVLNKIQLLIGK
jgi:mRNA interferase MazF